MSKRNRDKRLHKATAPPPQARSRLPLLIGTGAVVAALLAASFVLPGMLGRGQSAGGSRHATGDGPNVGARIAFAERDVVSGAEISSRTLRGRRTLLFFSEGVMCQACFEQIRDIEKIDAELKRRDIRLVSITPDPPQTLREAMDAYGIDSPMIADDDLTMSAAFDTVGQGMHANKPGHAFVLLDRRGRVTWQRDYWLSPYETMYVDPATLLADLPAGRAS